MAESGLTVEDALVRALRKLSKKKFKRFKKTLSGWKTADTCISITQDQLEGGDPTHVAELIRRHYKESYGTEVALAVLGAIDERTVREELQHDLQKDLTTEFSSQKGETVVYCVPITGDIRDWTRQMAQPPHRKGNSLSKSSFVDKHREVLIREVSLVEPVLDGLISECLLTVDQYDFVRSKTTSQDKMRGLYDFVKSWGDGDKCKLYNILKDNNGPLIRKLKQAAIPLEPS